MKMLITICARGGSKGIPGKNIKLLADKPLLEYSFIVAKAFQQIYPESDIALSTDSQEIIDTAIKLGNTVPYKRPDDLATDKAGKISAIDNVLRFYEKQTGKRYDYILDLDVTSPLRNLQDLLSAFEMIQTDGNALNLFSVNPANRNPYFNMVEKQQNGYYGLCKKTDQPILGRQSAPKVYDMNASFYFYRRNFFDSGLQSAITNRSLIYEMPHICFDLDHPVDFEFLFFLIINDKLDFDWL